jgi:hypothetical protein
MHVIVSGGFIALDVRMPNTGSAQIVSLIVGLTVTIAVAIYAYRTALALGSRAAWVWAIALLVPCVNLITLLILSAKATRVCRRHGIPVGFFGPRIS